MSALNDDQQELLGSITNFITLEARYKVAYSYLHNQKASLSNELSRRKTPKESLFFTALDRVTNWILEGNGEEFLEGVGLNLIITEIKNMSNDKLQPYLNKLSDEILEEETKIEKLIPHDGDTIAQIEEKITYYLSQATDGFEESQAAPASTYWQNKIKN